MIVVVGAGPAGLTTARELHRSGHHVVVVDAAPVVGGMAASPTVSGVRVDLGSHRLHPAMPERVRTMIEGLIDVQVRPRNGRIRLGDRWLPFPLTPIGLVRGLPGTVALRAAVDAATGAFRTARSDSYAEVIRAGFGPTVWKQFHEPFAWKLWDTDPRELSGELARRRVSASGPADIARRLVRGLRRPPSFLYPRQGFGAVAEGLAADLPDLRLATKVTGLIEHGDRVIVGLADGRILTASHVFSTLPAGLTATWLGLTSPDRVQGRSRGMVLVYLTLDRRPYTPFDAHYLPDRHVLPTRLSEPMNYRDSATDPTDRTVLCAEIPCWPGDPVWRATDAELGLRVSDDLVRSGLPDPRAVAVETVRRPSVYPVMTPETLAAFDRAERAMDASRRVTVLGRQGLFTPDNTHHVIEMGLRAADCMAEDGTFDPSAWREARDGFREFVVED
ncbi:MAG: protoporphyrinogen/coproporphyrinogen oxidase [Acidimicrobiales bacterium]